MSSRNPLTTRQFQTPVAHPTVISKLLRASPVQSCTAARHSAPTAAPRIPEGPPIDAHALHGAGQIRSWPSRSLTAESWWASSWRLPIAGSTWSRSRPWTPSTGAQPTGPAPTPECGASTLGRPPKGLYQRLDGPHMPRWGAGRSIPTRCG